YVRVAQHRGLPPPPCRTISLRCQTRGPNLERPPRRTRPTPHQTIIHARPTPGHPRPRPGLPSPRVHRPGSVLPTPPHHRMAQRWHHRRRQRHHRVRPAPRRDSRRQLSNPQTPRSHLLPTRPLARPHPTLATQPLLELLVL